MMQPESLVQLVGSGNTSTVEAEWMRVIEAPDVPLTKLASYHPVLTELCKAGRSSHAESLAWAAIEAVSARTSPGDTLKVAGPFLQGLGDSKDLRAQVAKLYRKTYSDVGGLEALLAASGIEGGRPVRRALRTLEVALSLKTGDFLRARDDNGAARVDEIDGASWTFTIANGDGADTLDCVILADRYYRAEENDLVVLKTFAPDQLARRMESDVTSVLAEVCSRYGGRVDSETLESVFVPAILSEEAWSTWWTKARASIKKSAKLKIEGRSPYIVSIVEEVASPEDALVAEFDAIRDPAQQAQWVERYVRDCKSKKEAPRPQILRHAYDRMLDRTKRLMAEHAGGASVAAIIARRFGALAGVDGAAELARTCFQSVTHPERIVAEFETDVLIDLALQTWSEARPDEWQEQLLSVLPSLPLAACDLGATRLVAAGRGPADFDAVVQQILGSPVKYFEALLWLWDGPTKGVKVTNQNPVTLLMRIIRTLEDCRRDDKIGKEAVRTVQSRARGVLSARKYAQFASCLEVMDAGMASAVRTHLNRLDSLGRAVRDDLLRMLKQKFPVGATGPAVPAWAREDILFVTSEGMAKKQQEIDQHVNVKMRENAKAIGAAAELGDLSENSEYKFALEERDLLQARLAQMNAELSKAKVISVDDVPTEFVGVGTAVVFKRIQDGDRYELTVVGGWEADSTKGWFNYRTPLAQKILGKRIGETVDFDHSGMTGTYEIVELRNGLA